MADSGLVDSVLRAGSRIWRGLAPASVRGIAKPVMAAMARRRVFSALAGPKPELHKGPVVVSGFLSERRGVSQAAQLTCAGLKARGFEPVAHDLRPLLAGGPGRRNALPVDGTGGIWLIHANAPEAIQALAYVDPSS